MKRYTAHCSKKLYESKVNSNSQDRKYFTLFSTVISLSLCKNSSKDGCISLNLAAKVLACCFISGFSVRIMFVVQL